MYYLSQIVGVTCVVVVSKDSQNQRRPVYCAEVLMSLQDLTKKVSEQWRKEYHC